jgi:hypothetical protein
MELYHLDYHLIHIILILIAAPNQIKINHQFRHYTQL